MATLNGWNVIALPDAWGFRSIEWKVGNKVATSVSPFTSQVSAVFVWAGCDSWSATVTLPPMTADAARIWQAFFFQAAGGAVAFLLGDPLRRRPMGQWMTDQMGQAGESTPIPRSNVSTSLQVNGGAAALATVLALSGFMPGQQRVLNPGDLISVNGRLYQVNAQISADSNGNATVPINPVVREAIAAGAAVAYRDAQGLFRIPAQEIAWNVDENHLMSASFTAVEAR